MPAARIPPVPESPFNGSLRCIAVDEDDIPVDRNVLKGEATIASACWPNEFDVDLRSPRTTPSASRPSRARSTTTTSLVLGWRRSRVQRLPERPHPEPLLRFRHEPGPATMGPARSMFTVLTLVPCTQDFLRQIPGAATVQYLVFNEFEQRLSTSEAFNASSFSLSRTSTRPRRAIDLQRGRSGTLTGQTRMNSVPRQRHPRRRDGDPRRGRDRRLQPALSGRSRGSGYHHAAVVSADWISL